ncbi:hypothetical protein Tco_0783336 [Tanacetum coccineum]
MQTKTELTLEQTQQGVSDEVLVSIKGVEELKRKVKIKGEKKKALFTLRQKPEHQVILKSIHSDYGNPSRANIKQALRQRVKTMGENVGWDVYKEAIIQRFGSVFKDLMADLKNANLYLGGLPTELEMSVRMFMPKTLSDAYCLTNLHEATLEAIKKKNKPLGSHHVGGFGMSNDSGSSNKPPLLPLPSAKSNSKPNPATALKSPLENRQLFSLVVLPMKELEEQFEDAQEELDELENEELPQISLNAFNGASSFQTMRVVRIDELAVPQQLSPLKSFNRTIPINESVQPVSNGHLLAQKNAIEARVKELCEAEIINNRYGPFASSVVKINTKAKLGHLKFDIWKWPHRKKSKVLCGMRRCLLHTYQLAHSVARWIFINLFIWFMILRTRSFSRGWSVISHLGVNISQPPRTHKPSLPFTYKY